MASVGTDRAMAVGGLEAGRRAGRTLQRGAGRREAILSYKSEYHQPTLVPPGKMRSSKKRENGRHRQVLATEEHNVEFSDSVQHLLRACWATLGNTGPGGT